MLPLLFIVKVCVELGAGIVDFGLESTVDTEWCNYRRLIGRLELLHAVVEFHRKSLKGLLRNSLVSEGVLELHVGTRRISEHPLFGGISGKRAHRMRLHAS